MVGGARAARNAEGSAEDLAGTPLGSITFSNLLQFLVFLHRGSRGDPCGPSVLRLRPRRCRGGGTPASIPARPLPAHALLGLVVLGPPGLPVTPRAAAEKTTTPSRPRRGSLQHWAPGSGSTAKANPGLQVPGSIAGLLSGRPRLGAVVPSVPRSCYSFSVPAAFLEGPLWDYAFQNAAGRGGAALSLGFGGLDPGPRWLGSDPVRWY